MRVKLTKTEIDRLKAGEKRYEVWDTQTEGLFVRVQPNGRKTFYVHARTKTGRPIKKALGVYNAMTIDAAREEAQKAIHECKFGDPEKVTRPNQAAQTLGDLIQRYLDEHLAVVAKRTGRWSAHTNAKIALQGGRLEEFKHRLLTEITLDDMVAHYRKLCRTSVSTANTTMDNLRACWGWGAPRSLVNPAKFKRQSLKKRERFLYPTELQAFYQGIQWYRSTVDQSRADAVELMLLTGCRVSAAGDLRVEDVRVRDGMFTLIEKGSHGHGATRLVKPITKRVGALLAQTPTLEGSEFVFGDAALSKQSLYKAVLRIAKRAGLKGITPHTLRHTYATYAQAAPRQGLSIQEVAQQVGHASTQTTQRYAHELAPVSFANAQIVEDYLMGIIQDGSNVVHANFKTA
jgi:integrase